VTTLIDISGFPVGRDLSDSYPIAAAPTAEHAEMLLDRIGFIRNEIIPLAC